MTRASSPILTLVLTPDGAPDTEASRTPQRLPESSLPSLAESLTLYGASENSLLNVSSDLIALCCSINRADSCPNVNVSRLRIAKSIINLKHKIISLNAYPVTVAENLCLVFAIVIDEFVMTTEWGKTSEWRNLTLVADLFGFQDGGDRFYHIAERALLQPKILQEFLYVIYLFLKMGYRGRYAKGHDRERHHLISLLENSLSIPKKAPPESFLVRDPQLLRRALFRSPAPFWKKALFAASAILAVFLITSFVTQKAIRNNAARMSKLRDESFGTVSYVYSSETGKTTRMRDK